jgi:hypothetical protein
MADIIDDANELVEQSAIASLEEIRNRPPEAKAIGKCLYCEEVVDGTKRWCDGDCRDGWERERRRFK